MDPLQLSVISAFLGGQPFYRDHPDIIPIEFIRAVWTNTTDKGEIFEHANVDLLLCEKYLAAKKHDDARAVVNAVLPRVAVGSVEQWIPKAFVPRCLGVLVEVGDLDDARALFDRFANEMLDDGTFLWSSVNLAIRSRKRSIAQKLVASVKFDISSTSPYQLSSVVKLYQTAGESDEAKAGLVRKSKKTIEGYGLLLPSHEPVIL